MKLTRLSSMVCESWRTCRVTLVLDSTSPRGESSVRCAAATGTRCLMVYVRDGDGASEPST